MKAVEINFDGIIGPTHHYGGLSFGNVASKQFRYQISSPRQAALEGLAKMKLLSDRGVSQAVLPPHHRPDLEFLRSQGYSGEAEQIIQKVFRDDPELLSTASSASSMWAANAATVSPSVETSDGKVHFTPANLISKRHRSIEPQFTRKVFKKIFSDSDYFTIHHPLPATAEFADEGAANHLRICSSHSEPGAEIFVYGRNGNSRGPQKYPARQSRTACEAIIEQHGLDSRRTMLVAQSSDVIDAGVFHNDVISVANENVLVCHAKAFVNQPAVLDTLKTQQPSVEVFQVSSDELSVADAVSSYIFNSQLVTLPNGTMLFLAPEECRTNPSARSVLDRLRDEVDVVSEVEFVDVRQSMQNGGGPACLRLRVVLTEDEVAAIHQPILLTDATYQKLTFWVQQHYREELTLEDLADPELFREGCAALDELTQILELGAIYPFQK